MLYFIIAVTVLISILAFYNENIFNKLKFNAYAIKHHREGWRFFSYGFLHAGWLHLLINMYVLYIFGDNVEKVFVYLFGMKGYFFFLLLYAGGIIFSVLFDFNKHKENPYYNSVGASGAVSAIVFSSIIMFPTSKLMLLFLPIPMPAILFGVLYLIYSAYMSKRGGDNIGHSAHFWGAIFGIAFTIAIEPGFVSEFFKKIFG
jgi:membrane associated rhomboid family serine protease